MTKRKQFTIQGFMIVVAVVALPLALLPVWALVLVLVAAVLLIPTLIGVAFSRWLLARERRRLAAISFWGLAILVNTLYAACCIIPHFLLLAMLAWGWLLVCLPLMIGFGSTWTILSTRAGAVRGRSPILIKTCVIGAAMAPALTMGTLWPLYLAFFVSQPSLERLADRVAAGRAVKLPQRARVFRVVRSNVDAAGNVGLTIGAAPADPVGFVRVRSGDPTKFAGPPYGSDLRLDLWGGWSYREDD